jgi:predicted acylesterase/phospholipase RssA
VLRSVDHNLSMEPLPATRDVGVVLSGGSINGVMLELGFLLRLRESPLWPRVGCIFGTSSGALSGTMAALDRLDDLEDFLLGLQPHEAFRPHALWRRPLLGLHTYTLPETVRERVGDLVEVARELADSPVELVVCATDLSPDTTDGLHPGELAYSSRTTPPEEMADAILASAAISALVLPRRVGDRIATDGAWVRNFPLGHAYDHPEVQTIVAFRYVPRFGIVGALDYESLRRRLRRFSRVPPVRALLEELDRAEERERNGEPAHLVETIVRLMRLAVARNTALEELVADEKDQSIRELETLRNDLRALVATHVRSPFARRRLQAAFDDRFAASRFPFRHDRLIPRITVVGSVEDVSLEQGLHRQEPWTDEDKRSLIRRGYDLADAELSAAGLGERPAA